MAHFFLKKNHRDNRGSVRLGFIQWIEMLHGISFNRDTVFQVINFFLVYDSLQFVKL